MGSCPMCTDPPKNGVDVQVNENPNSTIKTVGKIRRKKTKYPAKMKFDEDEEEEEKSIKK